jgi:hypothetical protein
MVWVVSIMPWLCFVPGTGPLVHTGWEAGWTSELVWTQKLEEKSSAGDRTLVIQSVVRPYTDWATPARFIIQEFTKIWIKGKYIKHGDIVIAENQDIQ